MSYFDHQRPQQPYQRTFRRASAPAKAYPVDEDGDRIYTEDDYAIPPDGDAFLPDDAEEHDPADLPVDQPFSYMGAYDTLQPAQEEEWDPAMDDPLTEEMLTEEEREELRRSNWKLVASLMDFLGIIAGTAAILLLIALLVSLLNWLVSDVSQTFTLLQTHI